MRKIKFVETSYACPEQYDIVNEITGEVIGSVRLRFGILTAQLHTDDANDIEIFRHNFKDEWRGCFSSEREKKIYLNKIACLCR